jgi:hypothetical protein
MEQKHKISPLMRVLAGLLAVACAVALIAEFVARGFAGWKFLVSGSILLMLSLFVCIIGRSPSLFD